VFISPAGRRRLSFILTALSLRRRGFYTPYDYIADVDWQVPPYPAIAELFARHADEFTAFVEAIAANAGHLARPDADPAAPHFDTVFLSQLDAAALYTAMTRFQPARVVEIGSGTTTHFMARAVRDHALACRITALDPAPRTDISGLEVEVVRRMLAIGDADWLADLAPGDVLFIDSSHFLQQGFDVDILFNRVFPALSPGVIVD